MSTTTERNEIVVGVDGTTSSLRALQWAIAEAATLGASVEVVTAWHGTRSEGDRLAREAAAERIALGAASRHAHREPRVTATTAEGDAADVLVGASRGALMLVVGSRGRGVLVGTALGSVALGCLRHATCPVVVVRGRSHLAAPPEREEPATQTADVVPDQAARDESHRPLHPMPLGQTEAESALRRHLAVERYRYEREK